MSGLKSSGISDSCSSGAASMTMCEFSLPYEIVLTAAKLQENHSVQMGLQMSINNESTEVHALCWREKEQIDFIFPVTTCNLSVIEKEWKCSIDSVKFIGGQSFCAGREDCLHAFTNDVKQELSTKVTEVLDEGFDVSVTPELNSASPQVKYEAATITSQGNNTHFSDVDVPDSGTELDVQPLMRVTRQQKQTWRKKLEKGKKNHQSNKILKTKLESGRSLKPKTVNKINLKRGPINRKTLIGCEHCSEKFKSKKQLRIHLRIIHSISSRKSKSRNAAKTSDKSIMCPLCDKCYENYSNTIRHCSLAHENNPDLTNTLLALEDRKNSGRAFPFPDLVVTCQFCGVDRICRSILPHLRLFHSKESGIKETVRDTDLSLQAEYKTRRPELTRRRYQGSKAAGKTFTCQFCGGHFSFASSLCRHKTTCEQNPDKLEPHLRRVKEKMRYMQTKMKKLNNPPVAMGKMYTCRYCKREFRARSSMTSHRTGCSENPQAMKRYQCGICHKTFSSPEEKNEHYATHGTKNFVCDLCGKAYKTVSGIRIHKRKDHEAFETKPTKYHACEICDKKFFSKNQWQCHITKHSADRNHTCDICGKSFKQERDVYRHKNVVHNNKYPYYCNKCGHGLSKKIYLNTHMCGKVRRSNDKQDQQQSKQVKPETVSIELQAPLMNQAQDPQPSAGEPLIYQTVPAIVPWTNQEDKNDLVSMVIPAVSVSPAAITIPPHVDMTTMYPLLDVQRYHGDNTTNQPISYNLEQIDPTGSGLLYKGQPFSWYPPSS